MIGCFQIIPGFRIRVIFGLGFGGGLLGACATTVFPLSKEK